MYTHGLTGQLESWWACHAARHDDPQWLAYCRDYQQFIATKSLELMSEHSNHDEDGEKRFGMSKAGGCTRQASLKLLGYEEEPFSGSTYVTFQTGHLLEGYAICTLRQLGYNVGVGAQERVALDPFFSSASDGVIEDFDGLGRVVLSVKTAGYKASSYSGEKRKPVRRGFPELPFEGVRKSQPSWYAQLQAEMAGHGVKHGLVVVVAKDTIKAFEGDPYMESLAFYAELIERDDAFIEGSLIPTWERQWADAKAGRAGAAMVLRGDTLEYVRLPELASNGSATSIWGGPNQAATGTFSPCGACPMKAACKQAMAQEYRN